MLNITNEAASAAILLACDEGLIVQGQWHGKGDDGREISCLLGAIDPSVEEAADCNGELMPMWLAVLTPILFDGIVEEEAVPMARRYGEMVARWHVLEPEAWDRVRARFLIRTIDVAAQAARAEAVAAAEARADAAARGVRAAIKNSLEAARARAEAVAAAEARADAAARAARAAEAWAAQEAAARAAAAAAAVGAAAYLSMFTFLLDQIEAEITAALDGGAAAEPHDILGEPMG